MKLKCKMCGYEWEPRKKPIKDIRECPACKSRYWSKDGFKTKN